MGRTRRCNAKCNKPGREKQIPYYFTHMWNLSKINKEEKRQAKKKKKLTLKYREQTGGCQRGGEWGIGEIGNGE